MVSLEVKVGDHDMHQIIRLKHLGSIVQYDSEIGDVNHQIQVVWLK